MTSRLFVGLAVLLTCAPALAQVQVIVNDNFDSYADDAAFQAVWVPTTGLGTAVANAIDLNSGILTTDAGLFPGIQGKA
ncbi:MAG TPA: hypothetical protein PJ982_11360, partial [Lacipirellulaceae bacterium]|nr:hypothetical protein [Lacipirellulaceae bacterium]